MKKKLLKFIKVPDLIISRFYPTKIRTKNSLIIFTFHGIFLNENDKFLDYVDPRLFMTIENLTQFVEYSLDKDFTFISPNDLLQGLNIEKNNILLTFDDGYFNNTLVLSLLRKYKLPACFFISTNHVKYNKSFWWDVLYREGKKRNLSLKQMIKIKKQLKLKTSEDCEKYLIDLFGEEAFTPIGDIDRPFTPYELNELSKNKLVFLGNHTCNHNILLRYSLDEINTIILSSQQYISDVTGVTPFAISYPDGCYSKEIITIVKNIGLKLGFTGEFRKYYLPIDNQFDDYMKFGRFNFYGYDSLKESLEFLNLVMSDGIFIQWIFRKYF